MFLQHVQAHVIPSVTRPAQDTFQHSFLMYRELTGPVIIVIVKIRAKAHSLRSERGVESSQTGDCCHCRSKCILFAWRCTSSRGCSLVSVTAWGSHLRESSASSGYDAMEETHGQILSTCPTVVWTLEDLAQKEWEESVAML